MVHYNAWLSIWYTILSGYRHLVLKYKRLIVVLPIYRKRGLTFRGTSSERPLCLASLSVYWQYTNLLYLDFNIYCITWYIVWLDIWYINCMAWHFLARFVISARYFLDSWYYRNSWLGILVYYLLTAYLISWYIVLLEYIFSYQDTKTTF